MDGRAARGARNRQAVIDAALDLIAEGQAHQSPTTSASLPTARAIAERAGVATRSVFHHFADLDSLFADAADIQAARHWHILQPPDPTRPRSDRISEAVDQRGRLFERVTATRRVAALHEHESPVLAQRMGESRAALRRHLHHALGPELAGLNRATVGALDAAASWETWEVLRRRQGLPVEAATDAVTTLLTATLDRCLPVSRL